MLTPFVNTDKVQVKEVGIKLSFQGFRKHCKQTEPSHNLFNLKLNINLLLTNALV